MPTKASDRPIGTCSECGDWGWLHYRWVCLPCQHWRQAHARGTCSSCGQPDRLLSNGHCRACWKEAARRAGPWNTRRLFSDDDWFDSHQVAIAGIARQQPPGKRRSRPQRPRVVKEAQQKSDTAQLELFPAARFRRVPHLAPPRPLIGLKLRTFWVTQAVERHAQAYGWSSEATTRAVSAVVETLEALPADQEPTAEEIRLNGGPVHLLVPLLTELAVISPSTDSRFEVLVAQRTAGLPEDFQHGVAAWIHTLHAGGARRVPRSHKTVMEYSARARPALEYWATLYTYLREVTASDVRTAVFATPAGSARHNRFVALRSLFSQLRRDRRIFANPASGLHLGARPDPGLLPLTADDYNRVTAAAATPLHRAVLVLAAIHGARPHAIRDLRLDDVDFARRELVVNGITKRLDDMSYRVIRGWLAERRTRWPLCANPHLLVTASSAVTGKPVSATFLSSLFRQTGVTLDRMRMDRYLEEALTYGPDPLHIQSMFGLSEPAAIRYTNHAKRLIGPTADPSTTYVSQPLHFRARTNDTGVPI